MTTQFCEDRFERPQLEDAQRFVGGYVELVNSRRHPNVQLLINEEGLLERLPVNVAASCIAGFMIVGPAMVLTNDARLID